MSRGHAWLNYLSLYWTRGHSVKRGYLSVRWVYLVTPLCLLLSGVCVYVCVQQLLLGRGGIATAMTAHTTAGRSGDTPLGGAEGEWSREERSEAEEKRSTLSVSDSTATSFWGLSTNSRSRSSTPDRIPVPVGPSESELLIQRVTVRTVSSRSL